MKYIIGQPGGPSGPFWSIVRSDGQVVAMQITSQENAQMIVDALMAHSTPPAAQLWTDDDLERIVSKYAVGLLWSPNLDRVAKQMLAEFGNELVAPAAQPAVWRPVDSGDFGDGDFDLVRVETERDIAFFFGPERYNWSLPENLRLCELVAPDARSVPDDLREELARYAHTAWSNWMRYLFSKCERIDGYWTIPYWYDERWTRQMNTEFSALPENEKESDRAEADKMLAILRHRPLAQETQP